MKTKLKCTFEFNLEVTKGKKLKQLKNKRSQEMPKITSWLLSFCASQLVEFLIIQIMNWLFYHKLAIRLNSFLLENI